jgi:hypothetical protein
MGFSYHRICGFLLSILLLTTPCRLQADHGVHASCAGEVWALGWVLTFGWIHEPTPARLAFFYM